MLAGFGNATVWLVVCAYLLAGAFIRTGLGPRIAYLFLSVLGHRALGLSYSLAATDLVLAPFIPSHTARSGGAIFPILQSVAKSFGPDGNADAKRTAGFVTMATYQASISTSAMFLTSMAGNPSGGGVCRTAGHLDHVGIVARRRIASRPGQPDPGCAACDSRHLSTCDPAHARGACGGREKLWPRLARFGAKNESCSSRSPRWS